MTEISVGFTIVTTGSLDPCMHFGLEVKWLIHIPLERIIFFIDISLALVERINQRLTTHQSC